MEKRKYTRIPFHAPVFINSDDKTVYGEVRNISHKGMYVQTGGEFRENEQVLVSVYFLEGPTTISITVPGTIVRLGGGGMGLSSPHIDAHTFIHFEYLIANDRGKPQQLMDDFYEYVDIQQSNMKTLSL